MLNVLNGHLPYLHSLYLSLYYCLVHSDSELAVIPRKSWVLNILEIYYNCFTSQYAMFAGTLDFGRRAVNWTNQQSDVPFGQVISSVSVVCPCGGWI